MRRALIHLVFICTLLLPAGAMAQNAPVEKETVIPAGTAAALGGVEPVQVVPVARIEDMITRKSIATAFVQGTTLAAAQRNGTTVATRLPAGAVGATDPAGPLTTSTAGAKLRAAGAMVVAPPAAGAVTVAPPASSSARAFIIMFAAFAVMMLGAIAINLWQRKNGKGSGGGMFGGGSSGHGKMRDSAKVLTFPTRFRDIAGCDEAVEELQEVVLFLKEPERFAEVGARMPRGVILHGPPGTGKTLLAKAVAGEADVPFYSVSGSDFVEMFVGVGASRVRDLFAKAAKHKEGAVIFFDEIDAIGRARGASGTPGNDSERDQTLNQLLVSMDGFDQRQRIVVIAATNRLDMLDGALLRPGRFDRRIRVDLPAEQGRLEILKIHAKGKPLASPEKDLRELAHASAGTSGADLQNILNEAAIMAARKGEREITYEDLVEGQLRALAGPQRKDPVIGPDELVRIAWHEAGHCLAAELCATHEKAQRITILARGQAAGLALYGASDHAMHSPQHLHERMVVAMGGRAAEQIGFGDISSGAANDLEQVNRMARQAISALGFSPAVGQLVAGAGGQQFPLAPETLRTIDLEVARMAHAAYEDALQILTAHRDELQRLAEALYAEEQIDRLGIEAVLTGTSVVDDPATPRTVLALPAE